MAGETILVCDDGKENRDFIVEYILNPGGYQNLIARNGLECLELARQHHPDLILLDLQMPKMNGMQVLDALREEELDIPVVLMTFHGSEEIAIEVYRKGVSDYVKKPFTIDEMEWAIERALAEVRLRKEKEALTERLIGANADMNQRIRELNTLYNVGKTVASLAGLEVMLPRVLRAAIEVTSSEAGSLYLLQGEELVCRTSKRPGESKIVPMQQSINDPFAWRAIQMGQPLVLGPAEMEPRRRDMPTLPMAVLVTPMVVGKRVIGALSVSNYSNDAKPFRQQDGAMLSALGDYAAIAIENSTNFTELARLKEQEIARIHSSLRRYIQPNLLETLLKGQEPQLSATWTELAVMLVELRGYKPSQDDVGQVAELVNHYMEMAADVIARLGGTVEKHLGDSLLAYFNAPEAQPDYLLKAIEAAVAVQQSANASTEGVGFSIGIHVGRAIFGNIGVVRGLGYAAVGEVMYDVQRLLEKVQPGQTLVTETLINQVGEDRVQATYLGQVSTANRRLNVYEINGIA